MNSLVRTAAPESEPVSLDEAKAFLRVVDDNDDDAITALISTAREFVEDATGRALLTQEWKYVADAWPVSCGYAGRTIELHRTPLVIVESVKYYPADGSGQATLDSSAYHVMTGLQPGAVVIWSNQSWPSLADRPDAVEVNFTAGAADVDDVPKTLIHAVQLMTVHLYENRGPVDTTQGSNITNLPFSLKHILESQRVGGFIA